MKRERLEDLGRIYEICEHMDDRFDAEWENIRAKDFLDWMDGKTVIEREDIMHEMRYRVAYYQEKIDEIESIAAGRDELNE